MNWEIIENIIFLKLLQRVKTAETPEQKASVERSIGIYIDRINSNGKD